MDAEKKSKTIKLQTLYIKNSTHTNHKLPNNIEHLFVVNENNGTCDDCVLAYSDYLASLPKMKNAAFVINKVQMGKADSLLQHKQIHIYKGKNILRNLMDPLSDLAYIKIGKNGVDTIIILHYPIDDQVKYIDSLIKLP